MAESDTTVVIYEENYSLRSIPDPGSALVLKERENLTLNGSLDLKTLVTDLAQVGGFIRIAYYATAGAGPSEDIHKLQMQIQDLGFEITDLCAKSAVTVSNFSRTTRIILQELKGAYQFLLDGFEDMAIDSIAGLSDLAKKMADAALELKKAFEEEQKKVIVALQNTQGTQLKEDLEKEKMKKKQRVLNLKTESQKEIIEETKADLDKVTKEREKYEEKEDKEIKSLKTGPLEIFTRVLTSATGLVIGAVAGTVSGGPAGGVVGGIGGMSAASQATHQIFEEKHKNTAKRAEMYRVKALESLKHQKELSKERQEKIQQRDDFLAQIEVSKDRQMDAFVAIKFLHQAIGALKELANVMHRASIFWLELQHHCQHLAEHSIKSQIENALERYTVEKRGRFWTSYGFKSSAVTYYAQWVALNSMCNEYMGYLKITQEELYRYIQENPTREKAAGTIQELIKNYRDDLKKEQENIMKNDCIGDAKREMLEGAKEEAKDGTKEEAKDGTKEGTEKGAEK